MVFFQIFFLYLYDNYDIVTTLSKLGFMITTRLRPYHM